MKTKHFLYLTTILLIGAYGCSDDEISDITPVEEPCSFYILCEGLFNTNTSTLGFYDKLTGRFHDDYFRKKNERDLGSTGNDMKRYGSKIWIVMHGSSTIEVINAVTGDALANTPIVMTPNVRQLKVEPRYITFHGDYAYVCCFNGYVYRIDTTSLNIDKVSVKVGRNPDGICTANNKLYVSNSGGMDHPNYERTLSVIDLTKSFTVTTTINVGLNPGKLMADKNGNVYVQIRGNYKDSIPYFKKIDSKTDRITKVWKEEVTNYTIDDATLYFFTYNYNTKVKSVKTIDLNSEKIIDNNLIPEITKLESPYGIAVHKKSKDIYITDAANFTKDGDMFVFNSKGEYKSKLEDIGIIPNTVLFMY